MTTQNPQDLPAFGRLLGLDFGQKYIGVAISDSHHILASPRPSFIKRSWEEDKAFLATIIKTEKIVAVVVGWPLNMDGTTGQMADTAASYGDRIEQDLNLPVLLWDERLTTQAAEAAMMEKRVGRQKRASKKNIKVHVDSVSATFILQGVLENLNGGLNL